MRILDFSITITAGLVGNCSQLGQIWHLFNAPCEVWGDTACLDIDIIDEPQNIDKSSMLTGLGLGRKRLRPIQCIRCWTRADWLCR